MSIWDALEKAAYTGLGLAALTKDKLDEAVETLKKERGLTEEEGRRLAEEMKDGADAARKKLDERVEQAVEKALAEMRLASKKELDAAKARIEILEAKLGGKDTAEK